MTLQPLTKTHWIGIWVLYLAGCTVALHVGKLPPALPLINAEFNLSLTQTGLLVSVYALFVALTGLLLGWLVVRIGYARFALMGLLLGAIGSAVGASTEHLSVLMISRACEGLGWIAAVVAMPTLLITISAPHNRATVMSLWSSFMPLGTSVMLFLAPRIQTEAGWQMSWWLVSFASLAGFGAVWFILARYANRFNTIATVTIKPSLSEIRQKAALGVFFCFLFYSFQFLALTAFLPTLLVEESGLSLTVAATWSACVLLSNLVGNFSAGWLLNRGWRHQHLIAFAALCMGVTGFITFSAKVAVVKIVAAFIMISVGGLVSGTLFSVVSLIASSPSGVGILVGFMMQGAGVGQLIGPIVVAYVVQLTHHWYIGGGFMALAAVLCIAATTLLRTVPVVQRTGSDSAAKAA